MKTIGDLMPDHKKEQREAEEKSPKHVSEPIAEEESDYMDSCHNCSCDLTDDTIIECNGCGHVYCQTCLDYGNGEECADCFEEEEEE